MAELLRRGAGKGSGAVYMRPDTSSADTSECHICRNWGLNIPGSKGGIPELKIDFFDIAESAELEQCSYCYAIYHSILAVNGQIDLDGYHLLTLSARKGKPFYVSWDDMSDGRVCAEVYESRQATGSRHCLDGLGSADLIEHDAASEVLFSRATDWIRDCEVNHPACQAVSTAAPKRLLFVGSTPKDSIRLIQDVPEHTEFIALSHCWGTNSCRTTRANLFKRVEHIPWDELPQTFQDAVTVARRFGIIFLWIDSLCIVQDDRADWASESARMGAIYEGASLTIAAASASDDSQGFLLATQARKHHTSYEVDMFPFSQHSQVFARYVHDVRAGEPDPLNLRGWTFQERLLPRRILTYSRHALIFECRLASLCECGSGLRPDPYLTNSGLKRQGGGLEQNPFVETNREIVTNIVSGTLSGKKAYGEWYNQVVLPFMNRTLSRPTDLLPAISALAEKFQSVLADHYLAGLWKADIVNGLIWTVYDHEVKPLPSTLYRAPSWSWASMEGTISFYGLRIPRRDRYHEEESFLSVHDAQCARTYSNIEFGEVSAGWLRLSSETWTAQLVRRADDRYAMDILSLSTGQDLFPKPRPQFWPDSAFAQQSLPGGAGESTVVRAPQGTAISAPILIVLLGGTPVRGTRNFKVTHALMLGRVTASQEVYQRIGIIIADSQQPSGAIIDQPPERKTIMII